MFLLFESFGLQKVIYDNLISGTYFDDMNFYLQQDRMANRLGFSTGGLVRAGESTVQVNRLPSPTGTHCPVLCVRAAPRPHCAI